MGMSTRTMVGLVIAAGLSTAAYGCSSGGSGGSGGNGSTANTSGVSTGTSMGLCIPGVQVTCGCPGGGQGAQVCKDDGSGFEACIGCATGSGGATGTSASATTGTSGSSSSGGAAVDTCNPITAAECTAAEPGSTCDLSHVTKTFTCFSPPNNATLCGACGNNGGPFCGAGMACFGGTCARYCCDNADCGTGKCALGGYEPWHIGHCVKSAADPKPACDAPAVGPTGSCFVESAGMGPAVPMYGKCASDADCSGGCFNGVCREVCGGQSGENLLCPPAPAAQATGVTPACINNPNVPCCKTQLYCALACTAASTCPNGTACVQGFCE